MRIAVLGATGLVGSAVVELALAAGHDVQALVRDRPDRPRSLPAAVRTVVGDARDADAVLATVTGSAAVLSSLGGFQDPESMSTGTANVVAAMRRAEVRRLVVMQGYHLDVPGDPHNLGKRAVLPMLWLGNRRLVPASRAMLDVLHRSDVDWTLVRAPRVRHGGPTGHVRTGHLRLGPWSSVRVGDVAELMLHALTDPTTVGTAPMVSAARRPRGAAPRASRTRPRARSSSRVPGTSGP